MSTLAADFESTLCASCGLHCDGTIFSHVSLDEGEDAKHYPDLGARHDKKRARFPLTCTAYDSATGCAIYSSQPAACRWFHCHLLVQLQSGKITRAHALEKIDLARQVRKDVLLEIGKKASFIEPCTLSSMFTALFGADASDPESAAFVKEHAEAYLALAALKILLKKYFWSGDETRPDTAAKEDSTLLKENLGQVTQRLRATENTYR